MRRKEKQKVNVKSAFGLEKALALLCCLIAAAAGVVLIMVHNTISSINYEYVDVKKPNGEQSAGAMNTSLSNGELLNDPQILNILLFGEDHRDEGEDHGRSDTMIMLSVDNRRKKLKMTSFMRDTYVTIPGYDGKYKLNEAYTLGGAKLSIQTVEANFGIMVDRYAVVDFNAFKDIIDTLGGIELDLSADEVAYINWQSYLNSQVDERYELEEVDGKITLNGRQALWYARNRGYEEDEHPEFVVSGDDFDRTQRQRKLLNAVLNDMKGASLTQIIDIVSKVGPMITTNLKKDEITSLVSNSLTYLSYEFEEYRVPGDELYRNYETEEALQVLDITDWYAQRKELALFIFESNVQT